MSIYGIIAWIATILSTIAYFLNIKKNKLCFLLWEIGTLGVIFNFIFGKPDQMVYYATAALFAFYGVMNIVGYYQWKRDEQKTASI